MTRKNKVLWVIQILVAALFLFAGAMKLVVPLEQLARQSPLPAPFLKFIGAAELLGAFGLVLPWLTRIRPALTPLAAAGLALIMAGAVVVTCATAAAGQAVVPFVIGVLAVSVAWGRRQALAS